MVDNYDSFTALLASYFAEAGADMIERKNDEISLEDIAEIHAGNRLEGVVISPGPKSPADCGSCIKIARWAANQRVPLLGVCLGHQVIAAAFGAQVVRGKQPMHGKVTTIHANGKGLFRGLPSEFPVTRYHSLVVDEQSLPPCLVADAHSEDGAVMALRHTKLPLFGVQFHPEAARTLYGHELIANFLKACEKENANADK